MNAGSPRTTPVRSNGAAPTEIVVRAESHDRQDLSCWPEPVVLVEHADLPQLLDRRLLLLDEPDSAPARGYRLLRHRLLMDGNPRVIAVTSALPGEGKTTCAVNLGLSIAEDTLGRVLLLDANARRPALAGVFGLGAMDGIQISARGADPCYAVTAIGSTRLHVASAFENDSSRGRLDRPYFAELLANLRTAYDYIIMDAASVLESADADVVSELSDGVVVTARGRTSRRGVVARAMDQLYPANILGLALIDL